MATDPDEKVAADAPSDATLSVTLSEEKEEDAVEDTQVDILEEDDDFEEFKEDRKLHSHALRCVHRSSHEPF